MNVRDEKIKGLRELADWLEERPGVPADDISVVIMAFPDPDDDERERMRQVARAMGKAEKTVIGDYLTLRREFSGRVLYEFSAQQQNVCEAVVVGQREVERPDPDAPKVKITEDIVEWRCPPLLAEVAR